MQAKQRDAALGSRNRNSINIKIGSRAVSFAIVAGIFICMSQLFSARIAGAGSALLFSCLLITASVWDVKKRIIPDTLCVLTALVGLLSFSPAKLFGVLIALPLFIAAMCKEGSVGGGDIKLTAAAGMVTGFPVGIFGLVLSLTASIAFYLVNQMVRKLRGLKPLTAKQAALPMAPFLCFGFLTAYFMNIGGLLS